MKNQNYDYYDPEVDYEELVLLMSEFDGEKVPSFKPEKTSSLPSFSMELWDWKSIYSSPGKL